MKKLLFLFVVLITAVSCQFSETMVLNEDGSGRMSLSMDLGEMMAFGGDMSQDSTFVKQDTIIAFRDILEEKKDSIAKLPKEEQRRLKMMENYFLKIDSDPAENKMMIDVYVDFKSVSEAQDLMKGFEQTSSYIPGSEVSAEEESSESEPELLGVNYEFKKGVFKRDAYIKDKIRHSAQVDSMKQTEAFMGEMMYKLKYTFPRKIAKASVKDATYSLDGKTIVIERRFIDYFKNPDVLDLTIELEK
jgi:hypothetical protein